LYDYKIDNFLIVFNHNYIEFTIVFLVLPSLKLNDVE